MRFPLLKRTAGENPQKLLIFQFIGMLIFTSSMKAFYRRLSAVSSFTLSPLGLEVRVFIPEFLDRVTTSWVPALLKYLTTEPWKYMSAPGPSVDRGMMAEFAVVSALLQAPRVRPSRCVQLYQMLSLSYMSLLGPQSCQPQPLGSRREAAPCEDTRQDCGQFFNELAWCPGVSLRIWPVGWEVRWPNVT